MIAVARCRDGRCQQCSGCQRRQAAARITDARLQLRGAATRLDGLGSKAHQQAIALLAGCDDLLEQVRRDEQVERTDEALS